MHALHQGIVSGPGEPTGGSVQAARGTTLRYHSSHLADSFKHTATFSTTKGAVLVAPL